MDQFRELKLLSEVDHDPETSQRDLARRAGLSLGVTNLLLRNLARKGFVRISRAGWRRWLYALTPTGASHKVQLLAAYVHRFLGQYQRIRKTLRDELEPLGLHAESRVAMYGTGEFAELVYVALKEFDIEEMDIFGPESVTGCRFLGRLVRDEATLQQAHYDRVVVAELKTAEALCVHLRRLGVPPQKLVTFFGSVSRGSVRQDPSAITETHREGR